MILPNIAEVCEQLDDVKNGSMVISSNGTITIASFTCQSGTSLNGTGSLECKTTGKWTSNIPTCGNEDCYAKSMSFVYLFILTLLFSLLISLMSYTTQEQF